MFNRCVDVCVSQYQWVSESVNEWETRKISSDWRSSSTYNDSSACQSIPYFVHAPMHPCTRPIIRLVASSCFSAIEQLLGSPFYFSAVQISDKWCLQLTNGYTQLSFTCTSWNLFILSNHLHTCPSWPLNTQSLSGYKRWRDDHTTYDVSVCDKKKTREVNTRLKKEWGNLV